MKKKAGVSNEEEKGDIFRCNRCQRCDFVHGLILSQDKNKLERDKDKDKEFASGTKIDKEVSF